MFSDALPPNGVLPAPETPAPELLLVIQPSHVQALMGRHSGQLAFRHAAVESAMESRGPQLPGIAQTSSALPPALHPIQQRQFASLVHA
jgi:hypothetical protein